MNNDLLFFEKTQFIVVWLLSITLILTLSGNL